MLVYDWLQDSVVGVCTVFKVYILCIHIYLAGNCSYTRNHYYYYKMKIFISLATAYKLSVREIVYTYNQFLYSVVE